MKKDILKFAPQAKSYLPKFNSRRFPHTSFASVAYKSDADETLTEAELLKRMEEMKSALEISLEEKSGKNTEAKLKAINETIEEFKAAIAKKDSAEKLTAEDIKQIKSDLDITIKSLDKFQMWVKNNGAQRVEVEVKSLNERIKEAVEENADQIAKFNKKEIKSLVIEIKAVADVSVGNITGGSVWGSQYRPGIIMNQNTMTQMRELITVSNAGPGTDYYFMRENGAGEGSIAPTSEKGTAAATTQATGLKPQFDLDLVEASVKFETIAGWMRVSNKAMKNIPNFVSFLQKRLPVKLMDVESSQILYGTGTSPEIKGILTAGNFVASTSGATVLVEKIIDDLALLEDTYKRLATGIAMRPVDYFGFFKNKAAGSGEYDLPQGCIFQNGILYIMGIPVAKTTALTTGDYVVGDFVMGTELLVQDGIILKFFEQDGDNVKTNSTTARIEETVALPVYGPDYFIKGAS